jgi:hypothetical protein
MCRLISKILLFSFLIFLGAQDIKETFVPWKNHSEEIDGKLYIFSNVV